MAGGLLLTKSLREVPEPTRVNVPLEERLVQLMSKKELQRMAKQAQLDEEKRAQVTERLSVVSYDVAPPTCLLM